MSRSRTWGGGQVGLGWRIATGAAWYWIACTALALPISLVPDKVVCVVPDHQDSQVPDRVHLGGWTQARLMANETNRLVILDPARLLEGYRKRPGRQIWDGEHVGKWLHAATLAWAYTGDPALRRKLDYVAAELCKCQLDDGYLGTYVEADRWTQWDVWAHKYNLIGLLTYIRYTGNTRPLATCRRMADLLCRTFGDQPGQRDIITAGQHMGLAPTSVLEPMVLLYRLTGEPRYLEFSKYILRAWEHPNGPKVVSTLLDRKRVDKVGDAKAYEMLSCLNGALEYYRTVGNHTLLQACLNAWDDIVAHRLYLTGAASYREFFHDDFDLPNLNNVGETCVTVTWLQFNAHLLRLTGEARFAEQLERVTLNQLFGAQCPDGSGWGYYVQMQGKKPYSSALDGHCCLSSGPRGIALIPTFALTTDGDGVVINLYGPGTADLVLRNGTPVVVGVETKYPDVGRIRITLKPGARQTFAIKLRRPAWCPDPGLRVNGRAVQVQSSADGYLAVRREWRPGDRLDLEFELAPRIILGQRQNEGRLAILYGPLVLAADEALLDSQASSLNAIGIVASNLAGLHFRPEPAPNRLKSWPGAQVFWVDGIVRHPSGTLSSDSFTKVGLVPFADAGSTGSAYRIWLPFEPPSPGRNLLMDGVEIRSRKPNAGSIIDGNFETIASTFNRRRAVEDWFGVQMDEPVVIGRIVFAHGRTFHDGGWFDTSAGKPRVEVKTAMNGPWVTLTELESYPAATATEPDGLKDGQRFSCDLPKPIQVFGVRVVGKPACGDNPRQAFASCAELQAFAPQR